MLILVQKEIKLYGLLRMLKSSYPAQETSQAHPNPLLCKKVSELACVLTEVEVITAEP